MRKESYRSGDNGLVESKNGAIIRKHLGFGHIGAQYAEAVDQFHREFLNPYINFHRPCAVPQIVEEPSGKRRRIYSRWDTPFAIFRQMPQCEMYLKPGVSLASLDQFALEQTDTEAAIAMLRAKQKLLARVKQSA